MTDWLYQKMPTGHGMQNQLSKLDISGQNKKIPFQKIFFRLKFILLTFSKYFISAHCGIFVKMILVGITYMNYNTTVHFKLICVQHSIHSLSGSDSRAPGWVVLLFLIDFFNFSKSALS